MSISNTSRIDWAKSRELAPEAMAAFSAASRAIQESGLDHGLLELIKSRVSQINGCAFCVEMHTADARKAGVSDEKLLLLPVWEETSIFTDQERIALTWAEALTNIAGHEISDDLHEKVRAQFSEAELTHLTAGIALINAWNRIAKPLRYSLRGVLAVK